ncbi:alpha-amylase family glycosyl hydrolase [Dysgonomonas sp. 25]|uniref:alpha-amylase family glycosyl hydrolase n=1 Tax=Dysgonomonas sp. 25 TaxID=2302933 RepID=UPI0013D1B1C9|nr:alpha-amylase family glycosyl hydrolase [Dysgonomonas sp. 25]NDV68966.1 alpha-amylase [Dysgonomonas sp. 25]
MNKFFLYALYIFLPLSFIACSDSDNDPKPTPPPSGSVSDYRDGITRISNDSLAFVLFAPNKGTVHLIGDFNNWAVSDKYKMTKDGDRFWIKIGGLQSNKEYVCQYLIDSKIRIADPYANKISDPWNDGEITSDIYPDLIQYPTGKTTEIAMVVSTAPNNYSWRVDNFQVAAPEKLTIYEILIRDFTEQRTIKGVKGKVSYLKDLGVNAVELMPFNEFEGNDSWGYNPSFYFAPDKAYGTSNDFKDFVDECHANGIAVIMDMVLNHSYGQSPLVRMYQDTSTGQPTADNPWYNQRSNFDNPDAQWGYDFNHESTYTQQFVDSVFSYWMSEYKIDGFRLDFTKGFTNTRFANSGDEAWGSVYDAARINILKRIHNEIKRRKPDALMICEHLSFNEEEKELSDAGILLWGNINHNSCEATMGWTQDNGGGNWNSDISWGSYKERGWTQPNLVTYMESHDEERLMYKTSQWGKVNGTYDTTDPVTRAERASAAAVILMSIPGPKMIWQFGELGYDYKLGSSMEDGRLDKKPIRWDYYNEAERRALHDVYAQMINLRKTNDAFAASDYTISLAKPVKSVLLKSGNTYICAIANFDTEAVTETVNFGKAATWKDYFTGTTFATTGPTASIPLQPGEYLLYISE